MERLAGQPFVLLGINSDPDREKLKQTLLEERINWRSWWDEGRTDGPIHTQWQVARRPAIFVLDADGVIRFRDVFEDDLDRAVDSLIDGS